MPSQIAIDFGLMPPSRGSVYLDKVEQIELYPYLLPYAHYLRQAWSELKLTGVLCSDGRPTVYFCEGTGFTQEQRRELHRFVWNQGLVPVLVLATPKKVEVHSAAKVPEHPKLFEEDLPSLITTLDRVAETLECARLVRSIETGQFFQDQRRFFPANESVDVCLVENLAHSARKLKKAGWDFERAHALLGRVLFVSFLEKREFIKPDYYPVGASRLLDLLSGHTVSETKRLLYREFFPRLRQEFNGTLFDSELAEEQRDMGKEHLDIVRDFLSGNDMERGQMTLGFWAYDFSVIPVETISAIYEEFLEVEDPWKKHREGAYYTPRHLAETALQVALEGKDEQIARWRTLDPACGSGIFLVAMFNLLAERWLRENSHRRKQTKAQALLEILQEQIRAIDINPTACRITAFSLYLALFEKLRPTDVDEFKQNVRQEGFLPPLLWDSQSGEPMPAKPVVIRGDFLNDDLPMLRDFHLVIGNPPWESRGSKQIALRFVERSQQFLRHGGLGCLLLPTTILVNRFGSLDGGWFRRVTVEKIVQLADFRRVLFEATHPCFILRYRKSAPTLQHTIAYETPKLNLFDPRRGVIVVEPDDQKSVPQRDVLEAELQERLQSIWLRKFWGTPRDEALLRRLDFYPRLDELVGLRGHPKRWLGGTGFQPLVEGRKYKGYEPVENPWPLTDPFIDARAPGIDLVVFRDRFTTVGKKLDEIGASKKKLLFARSEENFKPPMVIYSKGFTKCAFCNEKVRFLDSLRSIKGPREDADLLRFLAAVLSSRFFRYITFHSGSNLGIGRDQLHVYETLALPFPLPSHELATANADEIVAEAAAIIREVERAGKPASTERRRALIARARQQLEPLVHAYFAVTEMEKILIDETLTLFQPSIHKSKVDEDIPTLEFPERADRKRYAETLCDVLNRRARRQGIHISAEGMASRTLGLVFITVVFGDVRSPYYEIDGDAQFWNALKRASKAASRDSGHFSYLRGFTYFEPDKLHMLKPATMRNWCRTAALNDADAIFDYLNTR